MFICLFVFFVIFIFFGHALSVSRGERKMLIFLIWFVRYLSGKFTICVILYQGVQREP